MIFEIDFNRKTEDKTLEAIGARLVDTGLTKYPPFEKYIVEVTTFKELKALLDKVDVIEGDFYSAVISFDPPTIHLDKDI